MADIQKPPQTANDNLTSPNTNDNARSGAPTQPAKALSVVDGTSTGASNSNLAHVCDITGKMKYNIAWISLKVKELVEAIRKAIQGLWEGASASPFGDGVRTVINGIKAMVKQIQKLIAKAKEATSAIQGYIAQLQGLLTYIASIPTRIAKFLADCKKEATSSIKDAISNAQNIVNSQNGGTLSQASSDATATANNLTTTQNSNTGSSQGPMFQLS